MSVNGFVKIYRIRIFNRKSILLAALLFFLTTIYMKPINDFSEMTGHMVSPWIFPFLVTDSSFLMLLIAICICFFSNIPFMNRWGSYYILRCGKERWIREQISYIAISSFLITLVSIILSWISLLPRLKMQSGWGEVIHTLAKTNAKDACGLFWNISAQYMSKHTPLQSMLILIVILTLGITFVGVLMLWCSLFISRIVAVVLATSMAACFYVTSMMGSVMQKKLAMISPLSWMEISNFDVTKYGNKIAPSVTYSVIMYCLLIMTMTGLLFWRINHIEFIWNEEELR